jgi:DNA-directed RNA polymerase specialized sigma24 family protein
METVLAVHGAVEGLESFEPRLARLVEYRVCGGMAKEEMAAALGVSLRTVQRDWMRAKAWLQRELAEPAP